MAGYEAVAMVLFSLMDDLPDDAMPMDDRTISVSRANALTEFPDDCFGLVRPMVL